MSDADINALSQKILEVIANYSHFPLPILKAQSKRMGRTPADLTAADLPELAGYIGKSIADFSNPVKGGEVKEAILRLG
jgi:hypothetical protein